jgi:hypothetical protein
MPPAIDISSALTDARWSGRVLVFRSDARPQTVANALQQIFGAETFAAEDGSYFADTTLAAGLHLLVFRSPRSDYDAYEVIVIREAGVDAQTAGEAWGRVAGAVWRIKELVEDRNNEGTAGARSMG